MSPTGLSCFERVQSPSVILDGSTYKMWYTGTDTTGTGFSQIGYATSLDGITWTKYNGNPVLDVTASDWDSNRVGGEEVIKDGATYKMWYTGSNASNIGRIGYATSPDGITWTKYVSNPVLNGAPSSWEEAG
jgi:sucrose-6-phosphate hydrolase SacC (GH32 family)